MIPRDVGLHLDPLSGIVTRASNWPDSRDHYETARNAERLTQYTDKLRVSRDPYATEDAVARRAVVGLRIQAEMRHREKMRKLRQRVRMVPAALAPAPTSNVVSLRQRTL